MGGWMTLCMYLLKSAIINKAKGNFFMVYSGFFAIQ